MDLEKDRDSKDSLPPISKETDAEKAQQPPLKSDPTVFPDGGWEAWLVVAGGWCTVTASFGWINCIGVFQEYYGSHQLSHYSPSTVAWITSVQSFMLFFWGTAAGKFVDDYGPRWPILMGSFLHIFGLMMTSISTEYYQFFLSQSICSAIGCSFIFFPTITAAASWFLKHRALAFGIMVSGSSMGGIYLPIMIDRLLPKVGFGWTMRITAFLLFGLLIFGNLTVKSRLPPSKRPFKFKDFVSPLAEVPFLIFTISAFFVYLGGFLPFQFLIAQAIQEGMSPTLAGYLIPILNAGSVFGRIVPAHLGDKYGTFNVMIAFTAFGAIIDLALWLTAHGNAAIIVFAVLYGIASGCTLSILPAMVASISDVKQLGVRTGVMYAFSSTGVLVGGPIAGAIVAAQGGGYSGLKIFAGVTWFVGVVFAIFSRTAQIGWKIKAKV
ncbi:monocarboxylate permease-like protein [Microthyrium microscopicum]|uniref:Monocarboxylate permease-like protein n=1 Tax=Microthyrium microscopicum TaxID=703497 RepID=A0A6A6U3A7_9PEZI|nr:monocarboxylate permease-like protein [Microthyrium microscopicum]